MGVVIDGVRPGIPISTRPIQRELDRRKPGQSKLTSARREEDTVQILSGVFEGRTTGTPICMLVWNKDQRPAEYQAIRDVLRPGHAGYAYLAKYGIADFRGGGRSSGRETVARVAAGAFAKVLLAKQGILITGHTIEAGGVRAVRFLRSQIEKNSVRCADPEAAKRMERKILKAKKSGDSVGGIVEVIVQNLPAGLGDPVFDKLDADLAKALMSIGTVKGVEIGAGFRAARLKGSENNDPLYYDRRKKRFRTHSNNAGGIVGGISNGEDIVLRIAVKPPSSIARKQRTVTLSGKGVDLRIRGRHDPCVCPRVVPVAEAMTALVLIDHLEQRAQLRRKQKVRRLIRR
jgi:chorismate synthase